jgi:hypothetical protein
MAYATIDDVTTLFRPLTDSEEEKVTALLPVVEDCLEQEAIKVGKSLDDLVTEGKLLPNVLKSVIVDVVARCLMTSTNSEPMTQVSQSALGYSVSGTYLIPGGGLFIKKSELARLGLKRQQIGAIDLC